MAATKAQVQKVVVRKIDRSATVAAILVKFGPMDKPTLLADYQRVDKAVSAKQIRRTLYRLRKAGHVTELKDGNWKAA